MLHSAACASAAGLRYVSDETPGITRQRSGTAFRYRHPDGRVVRERRTLARIRAIAIPPAWTEVWICSRDDGHVQATGRDARRRKQYRYHPRWREIRDETKYARLREFAAALPKLRAKVDRDLARSGLPRERVLAAVVRLLERTLMRVGNDEYARENGSFGLTTLRAKHVTVDGEAMRFRFKGKSGKVHEIDAKDPRAARVVRKCRRLPGQTLFGYLDDEGVDRTVGSGDVNEYLREATGSDFTAKDFRTWAGTVVAAIVLAAADPPASDAEAARGINEAIDEVAGALGNTRAIARTSYVHPEILEAYREGTLMEAWGRRTRRIRGLSRAETIVARILRDRAGAVVEKSA